MPAACIICGRDLPVQRGRGWQRQACLGRCAQMRDARRVAPGGSDSFTHFLHRQRHRIAEHLRRRDGHPRMATAVVEGIALERFDPELIVTRRA